MIHVEPKHFGIIFSALSRWEKPFYAFGSRVTGKQKQFSDLDLAFMEPIPLNVLTKIKYELTESDLPYKIDIVDFQKSSSQFKNLIQQDLVPLPVFSIRPAETPPDWDNYHRINKEQIFVLVPHITYDPHHPTFQDPHQHRFMFRQDDQIIGIGQVELLDDNRAILRTIALDTPFQNQGLGTILLAMLERWAQEEQHVQLMLLHAYPKAITFYRRHGYRPMSFDDQKLLPESVDMGKNLLNS